MGYILSITKGERPQSFLPQLKLGGTTKEMGWASVNDTPDPTPNYISYFVRRKWFSLSNVIYSTLEPPPPVLPLQWLSNQTTGRKCHHSSSLVNHCWNSSNNNSSSNNNTHEKPIDFPSRVTMDFPLLREFPCKPMTTDASRRISHRLSYHLLGVALRFSHVCVGPILWGVSTESRSHHLS